MLSQDNSRPRARALEITKVKSPEMNKNPLFCKQKPYKSKKERNSVNTLKCTKLNIFLSARVAIGILLRRNRPQHGKHTTHQQLVLFERKLESCGLDIYSQQQQAKTWQLVAFLTMRCCQSVLWSVRPFLTRVWQSPGSGGPGTCRRCSCWRSWCGSWSCCCCCEAALWTRGTSLHPPSGPDTASGWGIVCRGPPGWQAGENRKVGCKWRQLQQSSRNDAQITSWH